MPLQLASPPPNAYSLIAQAMSGLSTVGGAASQVTKVADPSQLNAALPHQVYTLGSSEIAQGRNLNQARLIAWRFLIQYGLKTVAAIELSCDARGANLSFASLNTGPFAQGTRTVVAQAEAFDVVQKGSYELRVLKAPSVYVMAVWLKNLGGGDDIVLPIPAGPTAVGAPIGGSLPVSSNNFIQGLRSQAIMSLQFNNSPQAGIGRGPPGPPGGAPTPNRPKQ